MLNKIFRRQYLNHSFYQWMNLISNLFIPLIIGILTVVLPLQQENSNEYQHENSRFTPLKTIESIHDQQKQILLNTYQQDLNHLIFKYNSIANNERISLIIRIKTLHTLRQLDPRRKLSLIQLLIDNNIQDRINISHADLSLVIFPHGSFYNRLPFINIQARNISFQNINLYQSNFSYSILDNSLFIDSNCSYTDFSYTSLKRTDWTNTDVTQAIFNYTNLYEAKITKEQLEKVRSLQGAILPNGSTITV